MFTACVLCYGDHTELAKRCLSSIVSTADYRFLKELRVGLNAVVLTTRNLVMDMIGDLPIPCRVFVERDNKNVYKYPLMRRMLHAIEPTSDATHVMWFDDDSYIMDGKSWWAKVASLARDHKHVGAVYELTQGFRHAQYAGIRQQPWFTGKEFPPNYRPTFCTGGWWTLPWDIIKTWDWPPKVFKHNGGDSMLGELCRQQGYSVKHFRGGLGINYDAKRGGESKALRRGKTTEWPWQTPHQGTDHHDFDVVVYDNIAARVKDGT